jgi:lysophospholipase L1-like esterase
MTTPLYMIFAGSSFSVLSSISYNQQVRTWLAVNHPELFSSCTTLAIGGHNTWSNLVRVSSALTADTQVFLLDHANDGDNTKDNCALEALIRKMWTYNPNIRIVGISSPSWNTQDTSNDALVATPTNLATTGVKKSIFEYYGVSYADYLAEMIDLVPETYHLNELVADTVHPTETGYGIMASLVEAFLPSSGAQLSGSLPDYLYADTPDFEETPTIKNGTAYDSKSGTWAEVGTTIESSTAGSTVVYSGTFRSFGKYRASGTDGSVEVDIDGGGFSAKAFYQNGYDIGTRAAHTITVRIPAGGSCKIDEFWTI